MRRHRRRHRERSRCPRFEKLASHTRSETQFGTNLWNVGPGVFCGCCQRLSAYQTKEVERSSWPVSVRHVPRGDRLDRSAGEAAGPAQSVSGCTGTGPTAFSWALSAVNRRCRADRDPVTSKRTTTSAAPDGDVWESTTRTTHPRPSSVCMTSCPGTHFTAAAVSRFHRPEIRARAPSGR